ncbi:MAG: ribulose 1,5-bisphosphate carboxylase [Alphaproteobacteria bacterium]|nr:ribulose 1,5-bisphosphate carboxylase [Alphaproteobacteria bacterium]
MTRIVATYHIRSEAGSIEARAEAVAVEQSVELPVAVIDDRAVREEIVGRVEAIGDLGGGLYAVDIGLAVATTGPEPGQLLNMLFGNASIFEDVALVDARIPAAVARTFAGPNHGLDGLRRRAGAHRRAMTCTALKPQGLPPAALAVLAGRFAAGGIDYIKDDHGLADQAYSPFAVRVPACAAAVRASNVRTGGSSRYVPSLSGRLDAMERQVAIARAEGLDTVLIAPMVVGVAAFHALVRAHPEIGFLVHPAMAGATRIAPPLLLGKLFRLFGADATIFPNHGGRFSYSRETCRAIAGAALDPTVPVAATVPVPAGGMSLERVPELLDFYGPDVMLLIGGSLLAAKERLVEVTTDFTRRVATFHHAADAGRG